jgi:hypothetical protein
VREAQARELVIPEATAQRALVGSGIEADVEGKSADRRARINPLPQS